MTTRSSCGFRPFPENGAYGHWACGLKRWHLSRHRYRNYTVARIPRIHAAAWLLAKVWGRWLRRLANHRPPLAVAWTLRPQSRLHWQRKLWPTRYEPLEDPTP